MGPYFMLLLSIYLLYSNVTYIYLVSCLVEIKLFQIVYSSRSYSFNSSQSNPGNGWRNAFELTGRRVMERSIHLGCTIGREVENNALKSIPNAIAEAVLGTSSVTLTDRELKQ